MNAKNLMDPIPKEEVEKLIANFMAHKKPHLDKEMKEDSSGKKRDTTSVWFDYEFCQLLIKDLQQGKAKGLRVYFGAYDKKHDDPDKRNKLTVMFVTTTGSETESEEAVDDYTFPILGSYNEGKLCPPRCNPPL
jgi:hypothetical protein